jgi:uncharacterized protein involved in outer membrane biogenesis
VRATDELGHYDTIGVASRDATIDRESEKVMRKRILIAAGVVVVLVALGLFFWARAVLAGSGVRTAVAAQIGRAVGQPVTIGGLGVTILPRVTMALSDITIGQPARITVQHLNVGTSLGALLSRRIEHANVKIDGARIQLPLPDFTIASSGGSAGGAPVQIVSIDDISVSHVDIVSGALTLKNLQGHARATADRLTFNPITFGIFGGRAAGSLVLSAGSPPEFSLQGRLDAVDVKQVMAFAGAPDLVSGTLSGTIDVTGRGATAARVLDTARGTAQVQVSDGVVKGLGLVRAVVLATSMRDTSTAQIGSTSADEPFSRLGGRFVVAGGSATTRDLQFQSKDVTMTADGSIRLDGGAIHLSGPLQLSGALSQQAGSDLVRYTAQDGRVTLPVTITGSAGSLHVGIDVGSLMKRALTNRAKEALKKLIPKGPGA